MRTASNGLRDMLGGYGIDASNACDASTTLLMSKVRSDPLFSDGERATIVRALEWCVRGSTDFNTANGCTGSDIRIASRSQP